MAAVPPGEPKSSPKPQPIGNHNLIILLTTCTLCILFILWKKADAFKAVISHQLKTITRSEGQIRLSQDDGPPSHEFLQDEFEEEEGAEEDALELDAGVGAGDVGLQRPPPPPKQKQLQDEPQTRRSQETEHS